MIPISGLSNQNSNGKTKPANEQHQPIVPRGHSSQNKPINTRASPIKINAPKTSFIDELLKKLSKVRVTKIIATTRIMSDSSYI